MAFDHERVTVGDSATLITVGQGNGVTVSVRNRDADSVFVGGAGVTAADGYELGAGEALGFVGDDSDELYGVVASGSARVDVLRQGV